MKNEYKGYLIDTIHSNIARIFGSINIETFESGLEKATVKRLRSINSDLSDFLLKYNFLTRKLINRGKEKDFKVCREINLKISEINPYDIASKKPEIYTNAITKLNRTVNKYLRG